MTRRVFLLAPFAAVCLGWLGLCGTVGTRLRRRRTPVRVSEDGETRSLYGRLRVERWGTVESLDGSDLSDPESHVPPCRRGFRRIVITWCCSGQRAYRWRTVDVEDGGRE